MTLEAIDALGQGRAAWDGWRASREAAIVLDGQSLKLDASQGCWNLSGCSLKGCKITAAGALQLDLRGADLTNARFAKGGVIVSMLLDASSCLTATQFEQVSLSGVDFSANALSGTSFFGSVLRSIRFGGPLVEVSFGRATLNDLDFSDVKLSDCSFASANLNGCRFDNAGLTGSPQIASPVPANPDDRPIGMSMAQCLLRTCSFLDARFERCSLARAVFIDCDLRRAGGMALDDTVLRSTLQSPDAMDDWTVLHRSYTGTNMVFNLIAMLIFFAPWIAQGLYWSALNQAQLGLVEVAGRVESELARQPEQARNLAVLAAAVRSVDPAFRACLVPTASATRPQHAACRPVWQVLLGAHEGAWAVGLSALLLAYNAARLFLTWRVALLREDERRSWQSPARASYHWLMGLHRLVLGLMVFAILAAVLQLGPRLFAPVWVANV